MTNPYNPYMQDGKVKLPSWVKEELGISNGQPLFFYRDGERICVRSHADVVRALAEGEKLFAEEVK